MIRLDNSDSHDNGIRKEGSYCVCVSIILIDSVFKTSKTVIPKYF